MSTPIEDYALIGDLRTAALVSRAGSIDWLCLPRFDSPAVFASLVGNEQNGHWTIAPAGAVEHSTHRYVGETLVLETEFTTAEGTVRLTDFMPHAGGPSSVMRIVEGVTGQVQMRMELVMRFGYGLAVPWVQHVDGGLLATSGPDALLLTTPVRTTGEGLATVAEFDVRPGERVPFVLGWSPSHESPEPAHDAFGALDSTLRYWRDWASQCSYEGKWRAQVVRSLVTLKALTYEPTGGIVAAPTTSLPEEIGGVRNWDYRFCWLRDATLTLEALVATGYRDEAFAFRQWAMRTAAGDPSQLQLMYGLAGERRLPEEELPWLAGYDGSRPVRIGNAAVDQFQLDVYGELISLAHRVTELAGEVEPQAWRRQLAVMAHLESIWREPDEGIWEVRGPRRHFVHSKVMAWVAFDRAIRTAERFELEAPLVRWRRVRAEIHRDVCELGFDAERGTFTQYYGSQELDAAVLLIPSVGFLPADDPRVLSTIDVVGRELDHDGFVRRYSTSVVDDGLPGTEGVFLPCSFWLADALAQAGRVDEATELFERLLGICNDLGLVSEEYDVGAKRLIGNFPQAFTHLQLIKTACLLSPGTPCSRRAPADQEFFGAPA